MNESLKIRLIEAKMEVLRIELQILEEEKLNLEVASGVERDYSGHPYLPHNE